jgi:SH3 domain-containing YSC84-like protein 1
MRILTLAGSLCAAGLLLQADTPDERLKDASSVFSEIMNTPDKGIPSDLLDKARCAVIVPGMKSGGFIVGAKYGRGFAICRRESNNGWGAPAAYRVEGGSFGFQIGAQNTDVVMLVMSERGMRRLLESKFTLGGEASVAAGPVGRSAQAQTDLQMRADILSWSRSRGAFAGVALTGATLRPDNDVDKELYGKELSNQEILTGSVKPTGNGQQLVAELTKASRHEEGQTKGEASRSDKTQNQRQNPNRQTSPEPKSNPNPTPDHNPKY